MWINSTDTDTNSELIKQSSINPFNLLLGWVPSAQTIEINKNNQVVEYRVGDTCQVSTRTETVEIPIPFKGSVMTVPIQITSHDQLVLPIQIPSLDEAPIDPHLPEPINYVCLAPPGMEYSGEWAWDSGQETAEPVYHEADANYAVALDGAMSSASIYCGYIIIGIVDIREEIGFVFDTEFFNGHLEEWSFIRAIGTALIFSSIDNKATIGRILFYTALDTGLYYVKNKWHADNFGLFPNGIEAEKNWKNFFHTHTSIIMFDVSSPIIIAGISSVLGITTFGKGYNLLLPIVISGTRSVLHNAEEYWEEKANDAMGDTIGGYAKIAAALFASGWIIHSVANSNNAIKNNDLAQNVQSINSAFGIFALCINMGQLLSIIYNNDFFSVMITELLEPEFHLPSTPDDYF